MQKTIQSTELPDGRLNRSIKKAHSRAFFDDYEERPCFAGPLGVPNAVIRNANHASARAFSRDLHEAIRTVDAIMYPSRYVDGGLCIAVYERALPKLAIGSSKPLDLDPELTETLSHYRITLV